jgi:hypothetical protein
MQIRSEIARIRQLVRTRGFNGVLKDMKGRPAREIARMVRRFVRLVYR